MRAKKTVCFFSVLLMVLGLMGSVGASPTTISFYGVGVTIDLAYPEEAYPAESIWHNITITASTSLTLRNFTVVIEAPVNSGWQVVFADKLPVNWPLSANTPFEWPIQTDALPQDTNGKLSCYMYVNTSQSADCSFYNVYTTEVREMTYSELLENYNGLLVDYTGLNDTYYQLLADYDTLNNTYNDLRLSYEALNSTYNDLLADYNALNNTHHQLVADYDTLNNTYNNLQSSYELLNSTYNEFLGNYSILDNSYNDLLAEYNTLESNYNDLDSDNDDLKFDHNSLISDYNELQSNYGTLNSTYYNLTEIRDSLEDDYNMLNRTYTDLLKERNDLEKEVSDSEIYLNNDRIIMFIFTVAVAALVVFIIYLKRKKQEPYVVIRKETVSVNKDEDS